MTHDHQTQAFAVVSAGLLAAAALVPPLLSPAPARAGADQTVSLRRTIWVQTMNSCRHALPGAYQTVHAGSRSFVIGPGAGTKPAGVGTSPCPAPRGNCTVTSTGCVSFTVPVPSPVKGHQPVTYTISQNAAQAAPNTVPCNGGSACQWEQGSFTVYPSGAVQARVTNVYPDGTYTWYPSKTGYAAATRDDPILFHDFVLGNGSCDGDHDADDHLTGTPNSHCDDDADRG